MLLILKAHVQLHVRLHITNTEHKNIAALGLNESDEPVFMYPQYAEDLSQNSSDCPWSAHFLSLTSQNQEWNHYH